MSVQRGIKIEIDVWRLLKRAAMERVPPTTMRQMLDEILRTWFTPKGTSGLGN